MWCYKWWVNLNRWILLPGVSLLRSIQLAKRLIVYTLSKTILGHTVVFLQIHSCSSYDNFSDWSWFINKIHNYVNFDLYAGEFSRLLSKIDYYIYTFEIIQKITLENAQNQRGRVWQHWWRIGGRVSSGSSGGQGGHLPPGRLEGLLL